MGKIVSIKNVILGVFFFLGALLAVRVISPIAFQVLDIFDAGFNKTFLTILVIMLFVFALVYLPIIVFRRDELNNP